MRRKKWDYFCHKDFDWLLTKPGTCTFLLIQVLIGSFQKNRSHKIRLKKLPENPSPVPSLQRAGCDIVRWGSLEYHIKPFFAQRCINPFIKSPLKMESSYNTLCGIQSWKKKWGQMLCWSPISLIWGGLQELCPYFFQLSLPWTGIYPYFSQLSLPHTSWHRSHYVMY